MRISDWSSDVCSSDLPLRVALPVVVLLRAGPGHHVEGGVRDVVADLALHDDLRAAPHLDVVDDDLVAVGQVLRQRVPGLVLVVVGIERSEEHTSELQSLMRISYAVFCLKKKTTTNK